jgi:uncharacterized protein
MRHPFWLEHQEGSRNRGSAQPHPASVTGNRSVASTGDRPRMGHRDSSAQLGRHGQVFDPGAGTAEVGSSQTRVQSIGRSILLVLVRVYKIFLSPFFGGACKYYPSCSDYAYEAIKSHGARRGLWLALRRLGRCRPGTPGGFDPVPSAKEIDQERAGLRSAELL